MKSLYSAVVLLSVLALAATAGNIATVTSSAPFSLDGHSIDTPGVNSFPLVSGDIISTSASAALVTLGNGSTVKLSPNSSVKLTGTSLAPVVTVISGSVDRTSNVKVIPLTTGTGPCRGCPVSTFR